MTDEDIKRTIMMNTKCIMDALDKMNEILRFRMQLIDERIIVGDDDFLDEIKFDLKASEQIFDGLIEEFNNNFNEFMSQFEPKIEEKSKKSEYYSDEESE